MTGAELLARWKHAEQGMVPPDRFIILAEQNGLIRHITLEAVRTAVNTLRAWQAQGLDWNLSVNLSVNDFADREMVEVMAALLEGFEDRITLEITETALMQDVKAILPNIERLRSARIRLSLDDYGTGFASMEYLKLFSFDEIKIDRSFVGNIGSGTRNLALATASIRLVHDLGAEVVAEGTEDLASAELLVNAGCDRLQGYLIARPMPLDVFNAFTRDFHLDIVEQFGHAKLVPDSEQDSPHI